jgi:hypothetical protein
MRLSTLKAVTVFFLGTHSLTTRTYFPATLTAGGGVGWPHEAGPLASLDT